MNTQAENTKAVQDLLDLSSASIIEYLERAIPIFKDNLSALRSSNPETGMNVLIHGVEGLQLVNEYLYSATQATTGDANGSSGIYAEIGTKIQADMGLIIEAMEKKDMLLLADVMEFELIDSLTRLQTLLSNKYGTH